MELIVPAGRVVGLDVARCVALVGMIATHVLDRTGADGEITLVQQLAGGRASALFAVLAGVSLALMSGRSVPAKGRERAAVSAGLAVRAALIAAVGLALGEFGSGIAVILTYYGLLFLLGIPFLFLRARALFLLSGAWLVVVPALSHLLRPDLPERGFESPQFSMLREPWQLLTELTFTGYYPVLPWLAYLLVGMAVGRLDLTGRRVPWFLVGGGAVLAVVSLLVSRALLERPGVTEVLRTTYERTRLTDDDQLREVIAQGLFGTTPTESWWWLAVAGPHTGTPFDVAHTIGSALLAIGVCVFVGRLVPRTAAVVFGAGAMTLTLYTAHVLLRTPPLWSDDSTETFVRHVVFVVCVGALFRLRGLRGPLEAGVATMARGTAELVRRTSETSARR